MLNAEGVGAGEEAGATRPNLIGFRIADGIQEIMEELTSAIRISQSECGGRLPHYKRTGRSGERPIPSQVSAL
jgi:hypothetical protein